MGNRSSSSTPPPTSLLRPRPVPGVRDAASELKGPPGARSGASSANNETSFPLSADLSSSLCSKLLAISETPELCDVVFRVGTEKKLFYSVKALLAAQSASLKRKLFLEPLPELDSRVVIEEEDIVPEAFNVMLQFLHSGRIVVTNKSEMVLESLMKLCAKYELSDLQDTLSDLVEVEINENSVLPLLRLATKYNDKTLSTGCLKFLFENGEDMLSDPNFLAQISRPFLKDLLASDDLRASELTIFRQILVWGKIHVDLGDEKGDMKDVLSDLLPLIRFPLLSTQDLLGEVALSEILDEERIISILAIQADKKSLSSIKKRKAPKKKRVITLGVRALVSRPFASFVATSSTRTGPTAPYSSVHDGGACIANGFIFAHYGNDGTGGNRVHVIPIDGGETRVVNLPFPTHGSYPCADVENQCVYVFEDSDSVHGNGFGRIDVNTLVFESLPAVPLAHTRYSSCCVQGGFFWKLAGGNTLYCFDTGTQTWDSSGTSLTGPAGLMADPRDPDVIWMMEQGNGLRRYSISERSLTLASNCPTWFNLGANYPHFLVPNDENGVIIVVYCSGTWNCYDSTSNTWRSVAFPMVSEGGHCFYDMDSGLTYFQGNGNTSFLVIEPSDS